MAHVLREHDWDVEVIEYAYYWTVEELQQLFKSRYTPNTKFIGFGQLLSIWPKNIETFCLWVKQNYPDVVIISGSSVVPLFKTDVIDYYIQGYAEVAIFELLKYLFSNGTRPKFLVDGSKKKLIPAIDHYPAYPMDSLMIKYQDRDFIQEHETLSVEIARGCKFSCKFCNFPVIGVKSDYSRNAEDFKEQLQHAYDNYGIVNYIVTDETFNDRSAKITKFADAVQQLDFNPTFAGYIRADLLASRVHDREELARMNFFGHFYGIESFNTESARSIGKGMESSRIQEALLEVREYFQTHGQGLYRGTIGLIAGLPYETLDTLERTKQWLFNNWQTQAFMIFLLVLYNQESGMIKGSILSDSYEKYGYERMPDVDTLDNLFDLYPEFAYIGKEDMHQQQPLMMWKNPNMDVVQASNKVKEFINMKLNNDFRVDSFSLSNRSTDRLTLKEKLSVRIYDIDMSTRWYIDKKLNL